VTIGAAIGVGAGLLISDFLVASGVVGGFRVDVARLGLALAIVYATTMVVTGPVASRLSRLAPAEAIRITS